MANKFLGEAGLGVLVDEIKKKAASEPTYNIDKILNEIEWALGAIEEDAASALYIVEYYLMLYFYRAPLFANDEQFKALVNDDSDATVRQKAVLQYVKQWILTDINDDGSSNTLNGVTFKTNYDMCKCFDMMVPMSFGFTKDPDETISEITAEEVTNKFA